MSLAPVKPKPKDSATFPNLWKIVLLIIDSTHTEQSNHICGHSQSFGWLESAYIRLGIPGCREIFLSYSATLQISPTGSYAGRALLIWLHETSSAGSLTFHQMNPRFNRLGERSHVRKVTQQWDSRWYANLIWICDYLFLTPHDASEYAFSRW